MGDALKTVWRPGSARTRWESSKYPMPPAAFMGEQGNGKATVGRIKGQMRGGERTEGRGKIEGNERKERGVVPHPKLNPGCATVI